jgi:ethanolamine transporter EutH
VAIFAMTVGTANGLVAIARGTVPLALFGSDNYGHLVGRIAGPYLIMQSVAPLTLAFVAERGSDPLALTVVAGFVCASLACLAAVRRPIGSTRKT